MKSSIAWEGTTRASRRSAYPDRYVEVAGVRVRYIEAGQENGGVPLIIVHGYNGSCDYWVPHALPILSSERHVIAPDLPGNGLSGRLPEHTLDTLANFIPAFSGALGIDRADLLGHSLGGLLSIVAVARRPERFRKLVLVDSAGLPELVKQPWLAPVRMLGDSSLRQVRLYPLMFKIGLRARIPREGLRIVRLESVSAYLGQIRVPTLVVWGSRDRVIPLEHGAYMAQHIRGARLAIIRGAGHMPFYEKPQECNRLVLGFLRA